MSDYKTVNPTTGEMVESYSTHSDNEMQAALDAAWTGFQTWRRTPLDERTALLERAAEILEKGAESHGRLMALEMGKPLGEGEGEAKKCAWVCRYYAEQAESFLEPREHDSDGSEAYVRYDPLGPVLAIMPWNFPFWQLFRFAAPALAAGNVVLLKHAPNTPGCGEALARIFTEAGAPEGVFQNLRLSNGQAAELIGESRLRGVTLTGSTRAGSAVAQVAGEHLKSSVMELGGSDPFIVFDDAVFDEAVDVAVASRCLNSGQSCIAAKRFLIHRPIYERFVEALAEKMSAKRVGDPTEETTDVGPQARKDLRDELARQVERAVAAGARIVTGGEIPDSPGFFYSPTVVTGHDADSPVAQEEFFGPVAQVFPFANEAEALRIANATPYGLGASLWTSHEERRQRMIEEIDAGCVFVGGLVKSDPRLPFGGVKQSGFGRELSREGMLEFVNQKTVWVK